MSCDGDLEAVATKFQSLEEPRRRSSSCSPPPPEDLKPSLQNSKISQTETEHAKQQLANKISQAETKPTKKYIYNTQALQPINDGNIRSYWRKSYSYHNTNDDDINDSTRTLSHNNGPSETIVHDQTPEISKKESKPSKEPTKKYVYNTRALQPVDDARMQSLWLKAYSYDKRQDDDSTNNKPSSTVHSTPQGFCGGGRTNLASMWCDGYLEAVAAKFQSLEEPRRRSLSCSPPPPEDLKPSLQNSKISQTETKAAKQQPANKPVYNTHALEPVDDARIQSLWWKACSPPDDSTTRILCNNNNKPASWTMLNKDSTRTKRTVCNQASWTMHGDYARTNQAVCNQAPLEEISEKGSKPSKEPTKKYVYNTRALQPVDDARIQSLWRKAYSYDKRQDDDSTRTLCNNSEPSSRVHSTPQEESFQSSQQVQLTGSERQCGSIPFQGPCRSFMKSDSLDPSVATNYCFSDEKNTLFENFETQRELVRGPRFLRVGGSNSPGRRDISDPCIRKEQFNKPEFEINYKQAKFFMIKSFSEDDVFNSIKYNVWASTHRGNDKLEAVYKDAGGQSDESKCPVFLFFSVNSSSQFVGLAEMIGPVDFNKSMDFWRGDTWRGFFPIKWHILKDIPNRLFRDITLENNHDRVVTYSRDTQEISLPQGLLMLQIFKEYNAKSSILDDFDFYDNRGKKKTSHSARSRNVADWKDKDSRISLEQLKAGVEGMNLSSGRSSEAQKNTPAKRIPRNLLIHHVPPSSRDTNVTTN